MSDFENDHGAFKTFTGVKPSSTSVVHAFQGAPTAKTILITNNYTSHQNEGTKGTSANSITIVTSPTAEPEPGSTVVLDRINICINNHYDGQVMNIKEERKDPDPPKVATKGFKENDDVLVQQDDGKFFFGTVVVVTATQCLIKYDDNTKKWAMHSQLKRFGADKEEEGPLCVVCKKTHNDKVETCDGCGRGFHHRCSVGGYDNGNWYCHRCTIHEETESEINNEESETADPEQHIRPNYIEKLPYKLESLHWDAFHKENKEQKYCYCGTSGEWFRQMLQCSRCQQWFHEKCIKKLQFPVFSGDRFYVFVCKLCNGATEFVRRLEMDWPDLVQIALYNLTLSEQQKFFHIDNVIMRYLNDMKYALQISNQMRNDLKIREKVLAALADCTRFKNGVEQRVSKKLWALRTLNPPNAPFITLQQDGCPVTEHYIKSLFANTKIQINFVHSDYTKIKTAVHKIRSRMHGQYLFHSKVPHVESEGDSSKFESDDEIPVKFVIEREKLVSTTPPKTNKKRLRNRESLSDTSRESLKKPKTPTKTSKKRHSNEKVSKGRRKRRTEEVVDSSNDDDASSRSTLDFIIPPLKNFQGANNPFNTLFGRNEEGVKKEEIMAKPVKPPNVMPPNNGGVRIVRTVRRRLSAKDIIIGPNQQVKRKKSKRKVSNGDVEVISSTMINTNVATNFLPFRTEFKDWNNSSNSSSSLLPSQATSRRSSSASLTNGQSENIPVASSNSEMPSVNPSSESVTAYFAAINRIRNGEGYRMLGRRKNANGKIQYLIEWNGNGNTSLF